MASSSIAVTIPSYQPVAADPRPDLDAAAPRLAPASPAPSTTASASRTTTAARPRPPPPRSPRAARPPAPDDQHVRLVPPHDPRPRAGRRGAIAEPPAPTEPADARRGTPCAAAAAAGIDGDRSVGGIQPRAQLEAAAARPAPPTARRARRATTMPVAHRDPTRPDARSPVDLALAPAALAGAST